MLNVGYAIFVRICWGSQGGNAPLQIYAETFVFGSFVE